MIFIYLKYIFIDLCDKSKNLIKIKMFFQLPKIILM